MRTRLQRWLSPPIFPDKEQTRVAGLLNLLLLASILGLLLDAALLLVFAPETIPTFWMNGVGILVACILLWIMRRGSVRLAGIILCLTLWPLLVYYLATSGGLASPTLGFLSLFLVVGVTLFGTRGAIGLGLLNIVCLGGFYLVESSGLLVSMEAPPTLSRLFATNSGLLLLLACLLAISGHSVHDALARARNGERALAERNRELQHEIAERKRTEEALRKGEERYRLISELISDYAYAYSVAPDNTLVHEWLTEDSFERITGFTREEIDRRGTFALYHPEDVPAVQRDLERVLAGQVSGGEFRIITQSGAVRWLRIYRRPVWDTQQKRVVHFYGVAQDITERKEAEEALRASRETLQAIIDVSPLAITLLDMNNTVQLWNPAAERIFGWTAQEVMGQPNPLIPKEYQDEYGSLSAQVFDGGQLTTQELTRQRKDGSRVIVNLSSAALYDSRGIPRARMAIIDDITERKQAEEALRVSEERYRVISEMISDYAFCIRVEPDGTMEAEWITESFTRLTGYTSAEMLEREAQQRYTLFHPDDQARMDAEMAKLLRGKPVDNEYRMITKTGETRWLHLYRQPVWDDTQQRVVRYYGVANDITERKCAEQELQRRDTILEAISTATNYFLRAADWQQEIANVLGILGEAAVVDRTGIFQLHTDAQGKRLASLRYEWDAPGTLPMLDNPLVQDIDLFEMELGPMLDHFAGRQPVYFHVKDRPPAKRAVGKSTGTKTFLILPILLHGAPWGALVLSMTREEREWSKGELEVLQIAADMLGTVMERKQAEALLAKERMLLRKVIDLLPDNIFVKDRDSRFVLNNAASLATLGVSRQEDLLGKSDLDFFPRELAEQWRAQEQAVMQSGHPILDVEEFQPWRIDKRRWVIGSTIPLHDEQGEVFGLLGVSRDITDRKQAEDALHQSAARLNILHQIDQAILEAASAEGIAQAALQQIRQLIPWQYAAIEIIDPETAEHVLLAADVNGETTEPPGSRHPLDQHWLDTLNQGRPYVIPDVSSFPDPLPILQNLPNRRIGSFAAIPLIAHSVLIGSLNLMANEPAIFSEEYLEIGREVADQLAIAIEQARLYELSQRHAVELEQRVQERTEQLEAANRAKSAFLASVNHELRTPLNAVLGFTYLLMHQGNLTVEQRENLDKIARSGQHLLELINDVLDMSRIEAGRVTIDESSFDLYRTIREVEQLIALRAADKKLHLQIDITPGVPRFVISDQRKLRQILINLLSNAVKFTDVGSIVLRVQYIQAGQALDQPGSLYVEVEDTGQGIAEEEIGKLFQPFTQTESGRTMQQGTGLGLAITRQFVQILGGNISVKSRIGLGTTFAFTIPVKPGIPPTTSKSVSQRRVVGLAPGQMSYRILVVDDAEENRLLLCKLLRSVGFEVRDTANGKDAVELHEAWHPHLIFMDMKMPVMDGYEATRRIKASTQGQTTPIVALTASASEETHSMVLSAGCDDYLRKPLVVSELLTKIEQHLDVQFLFEVDEPGESGSSARHAEEIVLTRADLLDLPRAWISDLHALAVMADSNRMLKKIEEIQDEHPRLAKALTNLVKTFHLETILALTPLPMAQENDDATRGCQS